MYLTINRLRGALAILALLFTASDAFGGVNRWTTNGPTAAQALRVVVDPGDPNHLLVPAGILFESRDGAASWKPVPGLPVDVFTVAFDPSNSSIVYSGGHSGIAKSFDGGETWVLISPTPNAFPQTGEIVVDPRSPSTLYAANQGGVFVSIDSGCSWSEITSGLPVSPPGKFFATAITIDPTDSAVLYLGGPFHGAFKSVDHGAHWTSISVGIAEPGVSRVAVDLQNPGRLFAAANSFDQFTGLSTGALYRSLDAGATWSRVSSAAQNQFFGDVAIDLSDSRVVYAASSVAGMLKSTDGGDTWLTVNNGLTDPQVLSIVISGDILYASTPLGVFVSHDAASTWVVANSGMRAYLTFAIAVDAAHAGTVYAAGQGGRTGLFKSTDGGGSWIVSDNGMPSVIRTTSVAVDPTIPSRLWAGTEAFAGVFRSDDSGVLWTSRSTGLHEATIGPFAIDPLNSNRMFVGTTGGIYRTTDAGANWTAIGPRDYVEQIFFDSSNSQVVYALRAFHPLKSIDFGDNWTDITGFPGLVVSLVQSRINSSNFLAGLESGVWKSTDGGATWADSSVGLPTATVGTVAFDPTTDATAYAATEGLAFGVGITFPPQGVFVTHDGGATWNAINSGLTIGTSRFLTLDVTSLAVDPSGQAVFAGTPQGVYRYDISATPPPAITSLSPGSGTSAGGDSILISGSNFAANATVTIGGAAATGVTVPSANQIQATTPAGAVGAADVTVTNPDSQLDVLRSGFVYDFLDVPPASPYHPFVITLARDGIAGGCGGGNFCPDAPVTRVQAAVLIEVALHGSGFAALQKTGSFDDFDTCGPLARYIYGLIADGITSGCGPTEFCPNQPLTRAQMAVYLLRAEHGGAYLPPPCTGIFSDVPCSGVPGFAVNWIEQLFHEGVTAGCDAATNSYCPNAAVTRAQVAVFLVRALGL